MCEVEGQNISITVQKRDHLIHRMASGGREEFPGTLLTVLNGQGFSGES